MHQRRLDPAGARDHLSECKLEAYPPVREHADVLVGATHAAVGGPAERGSPLKQRIRPVLGEGLPVQILANRLEDWGAA